MAHASPRAFRAQPPADDSDPPVSRHRPAIHPPPVSRADRETILPASAVNPTMPAPCPDDLDEDSFAPHTLRSPPPPADLSEMTRLSLPTLSPSPQSSIRDLWRDEDEEVVSGPVTERTTAEGG